MTLEQLEKSMSKEELESFRPAPNPDDKSEMDCRDIIHNACCEFILRGVSSKDKIRATSYLLCCLCIEADMDTNEIKENLDVHYVHALANSY